jgi:hypothetical protein
VNAQREPALEQDNGDRHGDEGEEKISEKQIGIDQPEDRAAEESEQEQQ